MCTDIRGTDYSIRTEHGEDSFPSLAQPLPRQKYNKKEAHSAQRKVLISIFMIQGISSVSRFERRNCHTERACIATVRSISVRHVRSIMGIRFRMFDNAHSLDTGTIP